MEGLVFFGSDDRALTAKEAVFQMGLPSFLVYQAIWCVCNVPYLVIEKYRLMQNYKLQPKKPNAYENVRDLFRSLVIEQTFVLLPISIASSVLLKDSVSSNWSKTPSWFEIFWQVMFIHIVQDIVFYVIHRWLHTPWAYQKIHKVHHEYPAPFSVTSEHAHWFESLFGFTFPLVAGWFLLSLVLTTKVHLLVVWVSLAVVQLRSAEGHSGYYLPWQIDYWPLFSWFNGGAPHHDLHHSQFNLNFGARWLDKLFGTDEVAYRKKKGRE
eukprot:TRINITY_DN11761_c0_g1_i1.p1 TRINITY_DN11761_c0_g1~~TRINITY_DN11761_c0_g1_i1.p1  ORF type:complete len:267 (-),score=32.67 TRINITY_DN11761_c0_g1_i1:27-827(-)